MKLVGQSVGWLRATGEEVSFMPYDVVLVLVPVNAKVVPFDVYDSVLPLLDFRQ